MSSDLYRIHPHLPKATTPFVEQFFIDLHNCDRRTDQLIALVQYHLKDAFLNTLDAPDRLALRLFLEVIEDLAHLGWTFDADGDVLLALPPDADAGSGVEQHEVKKRLRATLVASRNEQLRDPRVRQFISKMERTQRWRGARRSVLDLFASPQALATDLQHRLAAPDALREDLLRRLVRPYLQRVTDEVDTFTGLRLYDIWRYCRYTWSLPYNTQPGRRFQYLVRDAARPNHPVMGIGALGNSMVQITCRDDEIGWTLPALRKADDLGARIETLEQAIGEGLDEIYLDDFLEEGVLTPDQVARPTEETFERLEQVAEASGRASVAQSGDEDDLEAAARSPRYRRKRAVTLRSLLLARRAFTDVGCDTAEARGRALLKSAEGRRALKTALRSIKKRNVGTAMMDITTCGALPPYNELLGGKLVGLLLASPEVIADYARRYDDAASHIASRMRGAEVVRPSHLALLCTTSLYYVGSSQYNRLRAPTANGELRYHHVGETRGFGSVHLSGRTYTTLQALLAAHPDLQQQSHRFAAGVNFKLRSIAAALNFLGLSALQRHENPRLVYTIPLATNWQAYLTGADEEPEWIYDDVAHPAAETQQLVDFWQERWLVKRVQRKQTLHRLRSTPPVRRLSEEIREEAPLFEPTDSCPISLSRYSSNATVVRHMPTNPTLPWTTLAELVGDRASFAEKLTSTEVEALHVRMKLDAELVPAVQKGLRLYLGGNPGDGKTHIIRRYEDELRDVFTNLDASATDEDSLVAAINDVIEKEGPAVVAVNEGPLRKMRPRLSLPDAEALQVQLDHPFVYGDDNTGEFDAVLLNLGVRQSLHPNIVEGALEVVLNRIDYSGATAAVRANLDALAQERVQERLRDLLALAAQGGIHVTMHQLFGFLAFIITQGRKGDDAEQVAPYYDLVFSDDNPLAAALRPLDPAALTHPIIDMRLWDGSARGTEEWLRTPGGEAPRDVEGAEAADRFASLKRQFYFEAREGQTILEMLPGERKSFYTLIEKVEHGDTEAAKQDLLQALARFFGGTPAASRSNELPIWTGLRYNALGPPTALVADDEQTIRPPNVELCVPRLRSQAARFIEYVPDHVRLRLHRHPEVALDVDLQLWLELEAVQRGLPPQYRDPVMAGRVERFLSRAAQHVEGTPGGYVRMHVRDVATGDTHHVDVGQKTFRL